MFIGHYAVSFAFKAQEKKSSLVLLFIAVQFLDIIFYPLTLLDLEKFTLIANYTESTHFHLDYMPYSHSLFATSLWSVVVFLVLKKFIYKNNTSKNKLAFLVSLAVMSHWWLDLIVHTADLPLMFDSAEKLGFGLWNNAVATYVLEAVMLMSALFLYMKSTNPIITSSKVATYGMPIFVMLLLLVNVLNIFGPFSPEDTNESVAVSGVVAYLLFALAAFWLDKKRF